MTETMLSDASPKIGRRHFLKLLTFGLTAPFLHTSCGKIPDFPDKGAVNALLLHLLGLETSGIDLFDTVREHADEVFDVACRELYRFLSKRYRSPSGVDLMAFVDDLNSGILRGEEDVLFLADILKNNAIMVFYASPMGFAVAGYKELPFQRTFVHGLIRHFTFPDCYTPCHASTTCYASCHPGKGAEQYRRVSREMSGDGP